MTGPTAGDAAFEDVAESGTRLRILVAIAHHGTKNRRFLDRMLAEFSTFEHDVDVVLLVERAKPLPHGVEVRVGLPTDDPWSLPFAHRDLFAERRDDYDLFVYSEDDTLITEVNLLSFVELSNHVPGGFLPGFMRYEVDARGDRSYCTVHSHYRWDPMSVFRVGELSFAHFTNEHGACYALTRAQLALAIESGGFLVEPHATQYDMLVSAATDIYHRCGFTKVFCLERLEDQLVHHLPNVYLGQLGVDEAIFSAMLDELLAVAGGREAGELLETRPDTCDGRWLRQCFPDADAAPSLIELIPAQARILSLGTSSGSIEERLVGAGHTVTAIPVDNVLGAAARTRGVTVLPPAVPCESARIGQGFDVLIALDVLHYLDDPVEALRRLRRSVRGGGTIVATVPHHRRYELRHVLTRGGPVPTPRSHRQDGMHWTDPNIVRGWLEQAGFEAVRTSLRRAGRRSLLQPARPDDRLRGNTILITGRVA